MICKQKLIFVEEIEYNVHPMHDTGISIRYNTTSIMHAQRNHFNTKTLITQSNIATPCIDFVYCLKKLITQNPDNTKWCSCPLHWFCMFKASDNMITQ